MDVEPRKTGETLYVHRSLAELFPIRARGGFATASSFFLPHLRVVRTFSRFAS